MVTEHRRLDDDALAGGEPTATSFEAFEAITGPPPPRRHQLARRRSGAVAMFAVVAALIAVGLVWVGIHTVANSKEGRTTQGPATPLRRLPATPAALLIGIDRTGQAVSLTVFGLSPGGHGGNVIVLPAGAAVDVVSGEGAPVRLGSGYASGGADGQQVLVESFLGITISVAAAADESQLAQLLAPLTPVTVQLDEPVIDTDASGSPVQLFPSGTVSLDAAGAARFLLARDSGGSEIDRLDRVRRFWTAAFSAANATTTAASTSAASATPSDAGGFVDGLRSGAVQIDSFPVTAVLDPTRNPDHADLLDVDGTTVRLLMARILPGAVSPTDTGLRAWVINPTGDASLSYRAVGALVYLHVNVMLVTESSSAVPDRTRLAYGTPLGQRSVFLTGIFGRGELVATDEPVDGIDVTITLGRDFQAAQAAGATLPPTTTTIGGG
ncbi:MAG: LytR cpsA psr family [Acidimicrobiaceae bacterium]|nr:LytR cpsA psr family [Acidimicrobiaceae bacterium]